MRITTCYNVTNNTKTAGDSSQIWPHLPQGDGNKDINKWINMKKTK